MAVEEAAECLEMGKSTAHKVMRESPIPAHEDVKTTMIYTHVLNREGKAVKGSVDDL